MGLGRLGGRPPRHTGHGQTQVTPQDLVVYDLLRALGNLIELLVNHRQ